MPKYIPCTAIPESLLDMEFRLKDGMENLVVKISRSNKTDFIKLKNDVYEMYAELHESLDLKPGQDMTTWHEVVDSQRIVSIQVQTTKLTGAGVEVVSYKGREATHWSLYTRNADGIASWVKDIAIYDADPSKNYGSAMLEAAKLSMEHSAFIEQVK